MPNYYKRTRTSKKGKKITEMVRKKKVRPLTKKDVDDLYKDDEYDKAAERGTISPYEAALMRKGKYRKPR